MTSGIKERVRDFVSRELLVDSTGMSISDDTPLMDEALIDSMGVFSLATFLEQEFGVEVHDRDLVPENFGSIAAIARFVQSRRGGGG